MKYKGVAVETGGKNAIIVMDDANLENAAQGAVWGAFGTTGQRCTATSRLIVHESVVDRFTPLLLEKAKKLKIGNGFEKGIDVGPLINAEGLEKVQKYVSIGKNEGKVLIGGRAPQGEQYAHGHFYEPTVISGVKADARIAQEEIFGPVVVIISVKDFNEAIRVANGTMYGLSASIYTENIGTAMRARDLLESGIVYINAPTIGAEVRLPFGGVKGSGNSHPEAGWSAPDFYSRWKVTYNDYSQGLQKAQIDTPGISS